MVRRPPRSTRTYTLCPYTTLFRSELAKLIGMVASKIGDQRRPRPTTVRRWATFYLTGRGDIRALIPSWHRRGNRVVRQYIVWNRSEEHTSELQSLMRISYAVFCLKKKKNKYIETIVMD